MKIILKKKDIYIYYYYIYDLTSVSPKRILLLKEFQIKYDSLPLFAMSNCMLSHKYMMIGKEACDH